MTVDRVNQVVNATVRVSSAPLSPRGFGRAAIVGQHTRFADRFRLYTSLESMIADGFLATDAEYLAAAALLAQSGQSGRRVQDWLVVRSDTPVAQVAAFDINYEPGTFYTVTISRLGMADLVVGPVAANTDDDTTAADIAAAVEAAAPANTVVGANPSANRVTITSELAGVAFTVTTDVTGTTARMDAVPASDVANVGVREDLAAAVAAGAEWYETLLTSRDTRVIAEAAAWAETAYPPRILGVTSAEAALLSTTYSPLSPYASLGSELKALLRHRTATWYHDVSSEDLAAAIAGRALPFTPGTSTRALKRLVGVTAPALTDAQIVALMGTQTDPQSGQNVNAYFSHSNGIALTQRGMMASGRFIDVTRAVDYLQNRIATAVFNLMVMNEKIPFTQSGLDLIGATVAGVLEGARAAGVLAQDEEFQVSVPDIADISASDRTNRVLNPPITWNATLSGAIHHAQVNGTVVS